jgi:hypothetical protein
VERKSTGGGVDFCPGHVARIWDEIMIKHTLKNWQHLDVLISFPPDLQIRRGKPG